jgi:hypothetical protein
MDNQLNPTEPCFKTKLIRGQTGGYGWEVTVYGARDEAEGIKLNSFGINTVSRAIQAAEQVISYPAKTK